MQLSDDAKRQAMSAAMPAAQVGAKEAAPEQPAQPQQPADMKRDAINAGKEVAPTVERVEGANTGNRQSPNTPNPELSGKVSEKLASMERSGYTDADKAKAMTKDDFTRG